MSTQQTTTKHLKESALETYGIVTEIEQKKELIKDLTEQLERVTELKEQVKELQEEMKALASADEEIASLQDDVKALSKNLKQAAKVATKDTSFKPATFIKYLKTAHKGKQKVEDVIVTGNAFSFINQVVQPQGN